MPRKLNKRKKLQAARLRKAEAKKLRSFVSSTSDLNGGAGLILPVYLAAKLRSFGISDGYIVQKSLPYQGPF
ncbi:hypothetical protein [Pseudogemmobacter bohemicus]|uniref:hypothetical protein n=1 Tax=Pseudogemmobacter bohemicus TaxID=2250708 RepID=UPI000DD3C71F|nr:hypothetical protein [Pseudogemmobacter bohemicus]